MSYVLFADDHADTRQLVRDVLAAAGHDVALAADGIEALRSVAAREPELLILDLNMPGLGGIEVCRRLKRNPFTAHIPVLVLTALGSVDYKIEGFEAGADDYLAKPFDPRELRVRVNALLRLVQREGDRNPTTGLPGGRAIEDELARRARQGVPFAVCYLDLDHFKPFCDTFGFTLADEVIRRTGRALRQALDGREAGADRGEPDFVGHIGGDDFIVVTTAERAESVARECVQRFHAVVAELVDPAIAAADSFDGVDRDGVAKRFPLARMTAAVLTIEPGHWRSTQELGARAAEVKRLARRRGAGTILVAAV